MCNWYVNNLGNGLSFGFCYWNSYVYCVGVCYCFCFGFGDWYIDNMGDGNVDKFFFGDRNIDN